MANIYTHNNLEVFIQKTDESVSSSSKPNQNTSSYVSSDIRQRTLFRQSLFDLIFLLENAAMIYLAKDTVTKTPNFKDLHWMIMMIVAACHVGGLIIKVKKQDFNYVYFCKLNNYSLTISAYFIAGAILGQS